MNFLVKDLLSIFFLSSFFLFSSCQEARPIHLVGRTMGTHYNVKFFSHRLGRELQGEVDDLLRGINQQMSTYIKGSEISYFNEFNRLGWQKISPDFFEVTSYALDLARQTQGKYDPTIGPLVNLWGFGPKGERKIPREELIQKALSVVGHDKILLNRKTFEIKKKVPGVYLDLSSVAKGRGVDDIAKLLDSKGVTNYMVEIGGEVRVKGLKKGGQKWKIAIEAPNPKLTGMPYQKVLELENIAVATSGNYRNFFKTEGKRYSHTIDAKTGRPVIHSLASVSVFDKSCMKADALATALMAMGPDRGHAFAAKNKIPAYFIYKKEGPAGKSTFVTRETEPFTILFSRKGQ